MKIANCIKSIKCIMNRRALLAAMLCVAVSAVSINLPIKKIMNRSFYYYTVEKGDTVYSLANKFGIQHSDMLKYNPSVADGLKPGMTLFFPVDAFDKQDKESKDSKENKKIKGNKEAKDNKETKETKENKKPKTTEGSKSDSNKKDENTTTSTDTTEQNETVVPGIKQPDASLKPLKPDIIEVTPAASPQLNVVVCLPFLLNEEKAPKTAVYATDFYRGFLLGIDSLRSYYGNPSINITAIDCDAAEQPFNALTKYATDFKKADIVIAPEASNRLEELGRWGKANEVYIFNTFQARDTTCLVNPYMLQGNALAGDMYDKVIDYFIANLNGATPVILDNEKSSHDKQSFVDALGQRLVNAGVDYKTLKYNGTLTSSAISSKLPPLGVNYIFVPVAGSLSEFQKFSSALASYKSEAEGCETPGKVRLFGYPEFTRFTGDPLEKMKIIGTTFYSRFYNDPESQDTRMVTESFIDRYGTDLPDGVPNQALYGFDVARWLIALAANGTVDRESIQSTRPSEGAQMIYHFNPVEGGGLVNDAVIIVTMDENEPTKTRVL